MPHRQGIARDAVGLLPATLEEWIAADNPVRVIDAFVDRLDPDYDATLDVWEWVGRHSQPHNGKQFFQPDASWVFLVKVIGSHRTTHMRICP